MFLTLITVSLTLLYSLHPSFTILFSITSVLFLISLLPTFIVATTFSLSQYSSFVVDTPSLFLFLLTLAITFISHVTLNNPKSPATNYILILLLLSSLMTFITSDLITLYIFYELSLFPIATIILQEGDYPSRGPSAIHLLLFTSIFSFPLIVVLIPLLSPSTSYPISFFSENTLPPVLSLFILFTFAVNLPIFGLHFWLPIAHVEAPTIGSVLLAALLLNLGGISLLRFTPILIASYPVLHSFLPSLITLSVILTSILTIIQVDINRLVAYSSVLHITTFFLLYITFTPQSTPLLTIIIVLHGLSSPIIFIAVGTLSTLYNTRNLMLIRGVTFLSPLFSFILTISFLQSIPIPPFPPFFAEVLSFQSILSISTLLLPAISLILLLSLSYNLIWYAPLSLTPITQSPSQPTLNDLTLILYLIISVSAFLLILGMI